MPLKAPLSLPWTLAVGDFFPPWSLPAPDGKDLDNERFAGFPTVVCFLPTEDAVGCDQLTRGFCELHAEFERLGFKVACFAAVPQEVSRQYAATIKAPYPLLADYDGALTMACRAVREKENGTDKVLVPAQKTFVLDPNQRVVRIYEGIEPVTQLREILEFLRGYSLAHQSRIAAEHAPVLCVPNVFSREFCRHLMHVFETQGNQETGYMIEKDGKIVQVIDHKQKIRRDHYLGEGELKDQINHLLFHRVRPEIKKAFAFEVSHFEEFKIIRYDSATGGYFRPHRDNSTAGGKHRVFAMSLNLNAEEYEGGNLRFPEYGPHCYRPASGEAVIFSCQLLHEATDVTEGRRYALLAFLFGEEQEPIRAANFKKFVPGAINRNQPTQPMEEAKTPRDLNHQSNETTDSQHMQSPG